MKTKTTKRAKVKCIAVLSCALAPAPVIVAYVRHEINLYTYLYMTHDARMALWEAFRTNIYQGAAPWPFLLRGHAIDAETGVIEDPGRRMGTWRGPEGLWVRADYTIAAEVVATLAAWREQNPGRPGAIRAPSWGALTAVRALALAAKLPDPMDPADLDDGIAAVQS